MPLPHDASGKRDFVKNSVGLPGESLTLWANRNKWLLLWGGLAIFVMFVIIFWDYSMDDAFITFRYARNLGDGYGLAFNKLDPPVEGYSNFLWLLLLAVVHLVGLPIYLSAKLIGVVCFALAGIAWFRHYASSSSAAWLAGPLMLAWPLTAFWGVSGLELGLHCLLIVGVTIGVMRRAKWLYPLLVLLVVSRPEGVIVGLSIVGIAALSDFANGRLDIKLSATGVGVVLAAFILLVLFRLETFGYPLPNTYYAKSHAGLLPGIKEMGRMMLYFAPLTVGLLWGVRRLLVSRLKETNLAVWITPFVVQALVSSTVNPIMNFEFRYLIPLIPQFLAVSIAAATSLPKPWARSVALAAIVLAGFLPTSKAIDLLTIDRKMVAAQQSFITWSRSLPKYTTISMTDMGRIPYYTDLHYYDIWGLTDVATAHEGFSVDREWYRLPDYFVFAGYLTDSSCVLHFGYEQMIADRENTGLYYNFVTVCHPEGVNPFDPGYYYLVYKRTSRARRLLKGF